MDNILQADDFYKKIAVGTIGFLSSISFIGTIAFCVMLLKTSKSRHHAFSYKNLLLVFLQISVTGYLGGHAGYIWTLDKATYVIQSFFANSLFFCYIQASWSRASEILAKTATKLVYNCFRVFIVIASLMSCAPIVTLIFTYESDYINTAVTAAGVCTFVSDLIFGFTYFSYLLNRTVESVEVNGLESDTVLLFGIIARFGIATTLSAFSSLICAVILMGILSTRVNDIGMYTILQILQDLFLFFTVVSLASMKVRLIRYKQELQNSFS
ncbi:hypothetical protein BCR33DRAFT_713358 [Rhizoclosmatium globosum]|uniref:Uncharacterized protein n=1 Tax=Rhizoclosmatium globosum TaxID=329046 RepID=A0A1Y2CUS9_9FUNG|nr:hypothetical protein BCR33DRAFT_713358 [Rhizoclosmatium globosum]|eukprot:ORY50594.1 hypothetical protein BCR33DRAFT_713358 [Rhizoclosmatium globosum]